MMFLLLVEECKTITEYFPLMVNNITSNLSYNTTVLTVRPPFIESSQ